MQIIVELAENISCLLPKESILPPLQNCDQCRLIQCRNQQHAANRFLESCDFFIISDTVNGRLLYAGCSDATGLIDFSPRMEHDPMVESTIILKIVKPAASCNIHFVKHLVGISEHFKTTMMGDDRILKQRSADLITGIHWLMRLQTDDCVQIWSDSFDVPFLQIFPEQGRSSCVIAKISGNITSGKAPQL